MNVVPSLNRIVNVIIFSEVKVTVEITDKIKTQNVKGKQANSLTDCA